MLAIFQRYLAEARSGRFFTAKADAGFMRDFATR